MLNNRVYIVQLQTNKNDIISTAANSASGDNKVQSSSESAVFVSSNFGTDNKASEQPRGSDELAQSSAELAEIPPLPEVQAQSNQVISQDKQNEPSTGFLLFAFVVVVVLFAVLIALYIKLKRQETQKSSIIYVPKQENIEQPDNIQVNRQSEFKEEEIRMTPEKIVMNENSRIPQKDEFHSLNLGTPNSIDKCIINFLEITQGDISI